MAVFYIGSYNIHNMQEFMNYPPKVIGLLSRYGGEVLASSVDAISLEGTAKTMNAIIRFPSMEAALAMYNDPEYQLHIKPIRLNSTSDCTMILVEEFS